jgi:hypothetical protein
MNFSIKILPIEILEELGKLLWTFNESLALKYKIGNESCRWNTEDISIFRHYANSLIERDFIDIYKSKSFVELKIALVKRAAYHDEYNTASRCMMMWFANSLGTKNFQITKDNIEAIVMYASAESNGKFNKK